MSIDVGCPCGHWFEVPDDRGGHTAPCPACGQPVAAARGVQEWQPDLAEAVPALAVDEGPAVPGALGYHRPDPADVDAHAGRPDRGTWVVGGLLLLVGTVLNGVMSLYQADFGGRTNSLCLFIGGAWGLTTAFGLMGQLGWARVSALLMAVLAAAGMLTSLAWMRPGQLPPPGPQLVYLSCGCSLVGWFALLEPRPKAWSGWVGGLLVVISYAAAFSAGTMFRPR